MSVSEMKEYDFLTQSGSILPNMKALKAPTQFITELGNRFVPKNEQKVRAQGLTALAIALVAAVLLVYHFLT